MSWNWIKTLRQLQAELSYLVSDSAWHLGERKTKTLTCIWRAWWKEAALVTCQMRKSEFQRSSQRAAPSTVPPALQPVFAPVEPCFWNNRCFSLAVYTQAFHQWWRNQGLSNPFRFPASYSPEQGTWSVSPPQACPKNPEVWHTTETRAKCL